MVGAGGHDRLGHGEYVSAWTGKCRHADADRRRVGTAQPGEALGGIGEDERVGPRQERAEPGLVRARELACRSSTNGL